MALDLPTFVELVGRMRQAQRTYFRTRRADQLEASKALEQQVDQAVRDFRNPQKPLFTEEPPR